MARSRITRHETHARSQHSSQPYPANANSQLKGTHQMKERKRQGVAAHEKSKRPTSAPSGSLVGPISTFAVETRGRSGIGQEESSEETDTCSRATLRPCSEPFSFILLILTCSLKLLPLSVVFFCCFIFFASSSVHRLVRAEMKEQVLGQWTSSPSSSFDSCLRATSHRRSSPPEPQQSDPMRFPSPTTPLSSSPELHINPCDPALLLDDIHTHGPTHPVAGQLSGPDEPVVLREPPTSLHTRELRRARWRACRPRR
jgi:hypothetical protein